MGGFLFTILISIGIPLIGFGYAVYKKRGFPLLLGILAFVVSQILFRLPILQLLATHSTSYHLLQVTQPIVFSLLLGFSAGLVENVARFVFMYFWLKKRDFASGFFFGFGHGGIEALLLVGLPVLSLLFNPALGSIENISLVAGIERFFAMAFHIGLSFIILVGIVKKKFIYVIVAILIHGLVDSSVGILPLFLPKEHTIWVLESVIGIVAISVVLYSIWIKRKGILQ